MYISVVTLKVGDIDRAVEFYTKKLGWQKTMDAPMGEGMRWVTVAPSETATAFTLMAYDMDGTPAKPGGISPVILETEDVYKTSEDLKKAGVEFTEEPRTEPWGGWAMFKDSEGNIHGLHSSVPATVNAG